MQTQRNRRTDTKEKGPNTDTMKETNTLEQRKHTHTYCDRRHVPDTTQQICRSALQSPRTTVTEVTRCGGERGSREDLFVLLMIWKMLNAAAAALWNKASIRTREKSHTTTNTQSRAEHSGPHAETQI